MKKLTFKEKQTQLAKALNNTVCALHDFNCNNEYHGERTLLTDEERKVLRDANAITLRVLAANRQ